MADAEYLQAHDAAATALEDYPDDAPLRHQSVLALARSGASEQALKMFEAAQLDAVASEDMLTLHGRLYKDRGLETAGDVQRTYFGKAAEYYRQAFDVSGGAYPAINVATLAALAGDESAANEWAMRVLAHPDLQVAAPTYYDLASKAEALLLLDRMEETAAAIHMAAAAPDIDFAARAATLKQLRLICGALGRDAGVLLPLQPPAVVHYCGHIIAAPGADGRFRAEEEAVVAAEIARCFAERPISRAVGSLAAGADILVAEAAIAAGATVDVVLPFALEEFIEISVRPSGGDWEARMRACLKAKRVNVHYVTEEAYLGDNALFGYASEFALGMTMLRARFLAADAYQLSVWDGVVGGPSDVAGTWRDRELAGRSGMSQVTISVSGRNAPPPPAKPSGGNGVEDAAMHRVPRCLLFGDFKGFSRLGDDQLPVYVNEVLGVCADVLNRHGDHLRFRNTWGDGLFLVLDDVAAAADCAFDLQSAVSAIDRAGLGLPETLGLRLGFHYGPVYETVDPVLERMNCFGFHVSRAARVEPITPENSVYVTETTAAAIAFACPGRYRADYVGQMPLAKNYGSFRMYHLRPATVVA